MNRLGLEDVPNGMNMTDWLTGILSAVDLSGSNLLWVVVISLLLSGGGLLAVAFLLVNMPAAYFCESGARDAALDKRTGIYGWAGRIAKNLLGGVLIILGAVMTLPGIPGPGLLIVLAGIIVADFPGKRRLERWFVSRPGILSAINRLRNRFGKLPMFLEDGLTASVKEHPLEEARGGHREGDSR